MCRSAFLTILAVLLPTAVHAQAIVGHAMEAESGASLVGAFVTLSDADGVLTARTLTNQTGRFTLNAPSSGSYVVRIEHIGFEPTEGPLVVEAGLPAEVVLRLAPPGGVASLEQRVHGGPALCRRVARGALVSAPRRVRCLSG